MCVCVCVCICGREALQILGFRIWELELYHEKMMRGDADWGVQGGEEP